MIRRRAGSVLLEALLLASLLAIGLLATTGLQQRMLRAGQVQRDLGAAVHLGQAALDQLRALDDPASLAVAAADPDGLKQALAGASAPLALALTLDPDGALRRLRLQVHGVQAGAGAGTRLQLDTLLAPGAGAWWAGPAPAPLRWMEPPGALRLGLAPAGAAGPGPLPAGQLAVLVNGEVWILEALSGHGLSRCSASSVCLALPTRWLSGQLLGALAATVDSVQLVASEHLLTGLDLDPGPGLALAGHHCTLDAMSHDDPAWPGGSRRYRCVLRPGDHDGLPGTPPVWSGRLQLQAASAPDGTVVCRLLATLAPGFDATASPPRYRNIVGSLSQQHLVLAAGTCPAGSTLHQNLP